MNIETDASGGVRQIRTTVVALTINATANAIGRSRGPVLRYGTGVERRQRADSVARRPPLAWFLPGPKRIRGGAARHFTSDRHFHRGIQKESTCRLILKNLLIINGLRNHDLGVPDSFGNPANPVCGRPLGQKPASGSHLFRERGKLAKVAFDSQVQLSFWPALMVTIPASNPSSGKPTSQAASRNRW